MTFAAITTESVLPVTRENRLDPEHGPSLKIAVACEHCNKTATPARNEAEAVLFALAGGWSIRYLRPATIPAGELFKASDFAQPLSELFCPGCADAEFEQ